MWFGEFRSVGRRLLPPRQIQRLRERDECKNKCIFTILFVLDLYTLVDNLTSYNVDYTGFLSYFG